MIKCGETHGQTDAMGGFWQIQICEGSRPLPTDCGKNKETTTDAQQSNKVNLTLVVSSFNKPSHSFLCHSHVIPRPSTEECQYFNHKDRERDSTSPCTNLISFVRIPKNECKIHAGCANHRCVSGGCSQPCVILLA